MHSMPGSETSRRAGRRGPVRAAPAMGVGLACALLGWLLAAPTEASFGDGQRMTMPYVPDAWAPTYVAIHQALGEPLGLSSYYFWGKLAFVMYLGGFALARTLPSGACRRSRVGRRVLVVAFLVGLVGDLVGYWGGAGDEMTVWTQVGFGVETLSMATMLVSLVVIGLGYRRDGLRPAWVPWLLVAAVVVVPAFNVLAIHYAPHGVLVPILLLLSAALAAVRDVAPGTGGHAPARLGG